MYTSKIDVETFRADPDMRYDLVSEVHTISSAQLNKLMDGMLLNVSDSLFELMITIEDQQQLTEHFNVMRELRYSYFSLVTDFNAQMADAWNQLLFLQSSLELPNVNNDSSTTLKCFVRRIRAQYGPLLASLDTHIAMLMEKEEVVHPLCPEFLYAVFWHSTAQLKLTIPERLLLVPLFGRFVADRIGMVLATINDLFQARVQLELSDETMDKCDAQE